LELGWALRNSRPGSTPAAGNNRHRESFLAQIAGGKEFENGIVPKRFSIVPTSDATPKRGRVDTEMRHLIDALGVEKIDR
jgi:hypothetical protein